MSKPFIPWMGGKSRLADKILPLFPEHTCYVEAFAGAGALFFKKQPSKVEVLNDLNGELVNLYRVIQHHLEEFIRQFKWALSSRLVYDWEKTKQPETLQDRADHLHCWRYPGQDTQKGADYQELVKRL